MLFESPRYINICINIVIDYSKTNYWILVQSESGATRLNLNKVLLQVMAALSLLSSHKPDWWTGRRTAVCRLCSLLHPRQSAAGLPCNGAARQILSPISSFSTVRNQTISQKCVEDFLYFLSSVKKLSADRWDQHSEVWTQVVQRER